MPSGALEEVEALKRRRGDSGNVAEFRCVREGCGLPLIISSNPDGKAIILHVAKRKDDAGREHETFTIKGWHGCSGPLTVRPGLTPRDHDEGIKRPVMED